MNRKDLDELNEAINAEPETVEPPLPTLYVIRTELFSDGVRFHDDLTGSNDVPCVYKTRAEAEQMCATFATSRSWYGNGITVTDTIVEYAPIPF